MLPILLGKEKSQFIVSALKTNSVWECGDWSTGFRLLDYFRTTRNSKDNNNENVSASCVSKHYWGLGINSQI